MLLPSIAGLGESLLVAARAGDMPRARYLLALGAPVNWESRGGYTPLLEACKAGQLDAARLLVAVGADLSRAGPCLHCSARNAMSPLSLAARSGCAELVRLLVAAGCNAAEAAAHNGTPIHYAANFGNPETLRALLDGGAALGALDNEGDTALEWAAEGGNVACIDFLVAAGQDPDVLGSRGRTPLHWAALRQQPAAVAALLRLGAGRSANVRDATGGCTPLMYAVQDPNEESVGALCAAPGLLVNLTNQQGNTALHLAVECSIGAGTAIVQRLLAAGVDPALLDGSGQSAVHKAAARGEAAILACLCSAPGARPNQCSRAGHPALALAARSGSAACCLTLLAAGASPQQKDVDKWLPLFLAAVHVREAAGFQALLAFPGVLEGMTQRLRSALLKVALQHGKRGAWLMALLPAGGFSGRVGARWAAAALPQEEGGRAQRTASLQAALAAVARHGLPADVLARIAACSLLLG